MARTVDLFIDSAASIETLAREVESAAGIRFDAPSQAAADRRQFHDEHVHATLGSHELENDRDMNFEDYRYQLSVRATNVASEEDRKRWRDDFARRAFDGLSRQGKYRLLLVDDLQHKLDEFRPRPAR